MNTNSLFKVLVLGGAMLTASSMSASEVAPIVDVEPSLAFCGPTDPNTCELNDEGKTVVKEGLVCCWATSCDAGE